MSTESKNTERKSKSIEAGWVCLLIGLVLVFISPLTMILFYSALFLAAFVLSIVGLAQGRIASGISLLLLTIFLPFVTTIGVSGYRIGESIHQENLKKETALSQLVFEDVNGRTERDYVYIEGKVRNNGTETLSFIKVGVEYLDKNGTILDTDYTFIVSGENLQPKAAKSFSIMTKRDPKMTNFRYHIIKD